MSLFWIPFKIIHFISCTFWLVFKSSPVHFLFTYSYLYLFICPSKRTSYIKASLSRKIPKTSLFSFATTCFCYQPRWKFSRVAIFRSPAQMWFGRIWFPVERLLNTTNFVAHLRNVIAVSWLVIVRASGEKNLEKVYWKFGCSGVEKNSFLTKF